MKREIKKERKTVGGSVNSSLLIWERSKSGRTSEGEGRMDGWTVNNNLQRRAKKNNKSREQALPLTLTSFHSTLLIRLWNTGSCEPSSPSGSHCLHYNITFTVITSRNHKIVHSLVCILAVLVRTLMYFWWSFLGFITDIQCMLGIFLYGRNRIATEAVQCTFKPMQ